MSKSLLVLVEDHLVDVGDISTVAPLQYDNNAQPMGCKVTFKSKGNYLTFHDLTPTDFMDKLMDGVRLELPN